MLLDARLFGRHQIAAVLGTAADFTTMIALVEIAKLAPPVATVAAAIAGGVVNLALARAWAFRDRHHGTFFGQASRYAAVSLGGAFLNGILIANVLRAVTVPYVLARVVVSVLVSVLYTYPLHSRVVFRVGAA